MTEKAVQIKPSNKVVLKEQLLKHRLFRKSACDNTYVTGPFLFGNKNSL